MLSYTYISRVEEVLSEVRQNLVRLELTSDVIAENRWLRDVDCAWCGKALNGKTFRYYITSEDTEGFVAHYEHSGTTVYSRIYPFDVFCSKSCAIHNWFDTTEVEIPFWLRRPTTPPQQDDIEPQSMTHLSLGGQNSVMNSAKAATAHGEREKGRSKTRKPRPISKITTKQIESIGVDSSEQSFPPKGGGRRMATLPRASKAPAPGKRKAPLPAPHTESIAASLLLLLRGEKTSAQIAKELRLKTAAVEAWRRKALEAILAPERRRAVDKTVTHRKKERLGQLENTGQSLTQRLSDIGKNKDSLPRGRAKRNR